MTRSEAGDELILDHRAPSRDFRTVMHKWGAEGCSIRLNLYAWLDIFFISGANSPMPFVMTPTQAWVICCLLYPLTVIVGLFGFQVAAIAPARNAAAKGMMFGRSGFLTCGHTL